MKVLAFIFGPWMRRTHRSSAWAGCSLLASVILPIVAGAIIAVALWGGVLAQIIGMVAGATVSYWLVRLLFAVSDAVCALDQQRRAVKEAS